MKRYQCYQAKESVAVVRADTDEPVNNSVVIISRGVGHRQARMLMRLCEAVLNKEPSEVDAEVSAWMDELDEEDDDER